MRITVAEPGVPICVLRVPLEYLQMIYVIS